MVDGIAHVNRALPAPARRPAGKRNGRKARERAAAAAPRKTIRIDADVREGHADVVAGGP
jgi:hypothetical protein